MPIPSEAQLLEPDPRVSLYDLDLSPVTGVAIIVRFVPGTDETEPETRVWWRGNAYTPIPIELEGLEVSGTGALPRPRVMVSNVLGEISGLIRQYGSLAGSVLTRWQTHAKYLDNGASPDPDMYYPTDEFIVDRVSDRDKFSVTFELRLRFDRSEFMLPRRQVLRRVCTHSYRVWTGAAFSYVGVSCPYVGASSFDREDQPTTNANDVCSKRLTGCRARFGRLPLPTRAFPAAGRIR